MWEPAVRSSWKARWVASGFSCSSSFSPLSSTWSSAPPFKDWRGPLDWRWVCFPLKLICEQFIFQVIPHLHFWLSLPKKAQVSFYLFPLTSNFTKSEHSSTISFPYCYSAGCSSLRQERVQTHCCRIRGSLTLQPELLLLIWGGSAFLGEPSCSSCGAEIAMFKIYSWKSVIKTGFVQFTFPCGAIFNILVWSYKIAAIVQSIIQNVWIQEVQLGRG